MNSKTSSLFNPIKLGEVELKNRFIMAPLTRCRAPDHQPNELMAEYYGQRASAGLIISECTMVMPGTSAFATEPGIYSQKQIEGWKLTTEAVHKKDGKIFMQIWHAGRAAHPDLNQGQGVVSASDIAIQGEVHTANGKKPYDQPESLTEAGIKEIIEAFKVAAKNAVEAGFDGVEIHGANGYLIDQFLRSSSNQRQDGYGGAMENRAKLLFEIIEAVAEEIGAGRVGVRLSPLNSFNDMEDENPLALIEFLSKALSKYELAFLHLMRADFIGKQQGDVIAIAREHFSGTLIVNMGYSPEEAATVIDSNLADGVAFGTGFLANPDFPERVKVGAELNSPDESTFYSPGPKGYTDYPALEPVNS